MNSFELKFLGNCPVCAEAYLQNNSVLVDKTAEALTLHVNCIGCLSSALVAIYSGITGLITNISMPTDLTRKDVARIKKMPVINSSDVLELHQYFESQGLKTDK